MEVGRCACITAQVQLEDCSSLGPTNKERAWGDEAKTAVASAPGPLFILGF